MDTKSEDPEKFVNKVRDACSMYYATAGPAFLEHLFGVVEGKDVQAVDVAALRERWDEITESVKLPNLHDQQKRVIRRLGVVALAGAMAAEFGILPYTYDEVCRYLADHGLLHLNSKPRYQSRFSPVEEILTGDEDLGRAFGKGSKVSFYAVESKILNFSFDSQSTPTESEPSLITPPVSSVAKAKRAW